MINRAATDMDIGPCNGRRGRGRPIRSLPSRRESSILTRFTQVRGAVHSRSSSQQRDPEMATAGSRT